MKRLFFVLCLFLPSTTAVAQDRDKTKNRVMEVVEKAVDLVLNLGEKGRSLLEKLFSPRPSPRRDPPRPAPPDKGLRAPERVFRYDRWDSWEGFKVGSSVTYEIGSAGLRQRRVIKSKSRDVIVVESFTVMRMGGKAVENRAGEEKIRRPTFSVPRAEFRRCRTCRKPADAHKSPTQRTGDRTIAGRRIRTIRVTPYRCDGSAAGERVYSRDIPGWIVSSDKNFTVVDFEARK